MADPSPFSLPGSPSPAPSPNGSSKPRKVRDSSFLLPQPLPNPSTQPLSQNPGKRPKILLFGDSLTQRGFEGPYQAWAAGLAHAYGRRADVINRGYSGYTAKWCAFMLESLFPAQDPSW